MIGVEEADEADALARFNYLGGRETVAILGNPGAELVHLGVGLRAVAAKRKEFHDALVGVDAVEEVAVAILPVAQDQALGADRRHSTNSSRR